jgi:hypothetical protein
VTVLRETVNSIAKIRVEGSRDPEASCPVRIALRICSYSCLCSGVADSACKVKIANGLVLICFAKMHRSYLILSTDCLRYVALKMRAQSLCSGCRHRQGLVGSRAQFEGCTKCRWSSLSTNASYSSNSIPSFKRAMRRLDQSGSRTFRPYYSPYYGALLMAP